MEWTAQLQLEIIVGNVLSHSSASSRTRCLICIFNFNAKMKAWTDSEITIWRQEWAWTDSEIAILRQKCNKLKAWADSKIAVLRQKCTRMKGWTDSEIAIWRQKCTKLKAWTDFEIAVLRQKCTKLKSENEPIRDVFRTGSAILCNMISRFHSRYH